MTVRSQALMADVESLTLASPRDNDATSVHDAWPHFLNDLKTAVGEPAFRNWLRSLSCVSIEGAVLTLALPSRFLADWVRAHYLAMMTHLSRKYWPACQSIELRVQNASSLAQTPSLSAVTSSVGQSAAMQSSALDSHPQYVPSLSIVGAATPHEPSTATPAFADWGTLSSPLDPRYTFSQFVVGKANEFAYAAAKRVAESTTVAYNPLFLYGGVGLGKTHLMHAIAWEIKQRTPQRRVVYLSAEKFMYQFIKALRFKNAMAFKEQFRSVDVLMVDDFQFICGKESTQEEFFYTFNALVDQNKQLIISADKSPSDLEGLEDRLRSRLGWGLVADIHPAPYELRLSILQSKADEKQLKINPSILEYIAHRITTNVRELEGALNRLAAHVQFVGGELTIDVVQGLLSDMVRAASRRLTVDEIQRVVAEHFNIKVSDMHAARRARTVARPRQVAMYLAKTLTPLSLPDIGRKFGGRDHTTVIHAVRQVESLMLTDPHLAEDIAVLKRSLQNAGF